MASWPHHYRELIEEYLWSFFEQIGHMSAQLYTNIAYVFAIDITSAVPCSVRCLEFDVHRQFQIPSSKWETSRTGTRVTIKHARVRVRDWVRLVHWGMRTPNPSLQLPIKAKNSSNLFTAIVLLTSTSTPLQLQLQYNLKLFTMLSTRQSLRSSQLVRSSCEEIASIEWFID